MGGGDVQIGYYDSTGIWHGHSQEDFCNNHPYDYTCMQQQQRTHDTTVAHVEVDSRPIKNISSRMADLTPLEWILFGALVIGILVGGACFVRFTPFSKGIRDLFLTLAKLAGGEKNDQPKGKK